MAVKIGDVTIRIGASTKELEADLRKAERSLSASAARFQSIGQSMTIGITVPVLAAGAAAFKMASDYEESLNKVRVSFGESSKSVEDFAKTTLTSFGIAEGSALEMAGLFGNMATSMGITQKDAAKLSTEMVGLAGDMASFNNVPLDQVQTALNSIFTGEAEPLKRFGINMLESSLASFALSEGITKSVKSMTDAEKISLRYAFVLDRTKNAQGDFSRTSDSASNQMRIFQESTKQLAASFGQVLIPAITPIINGVNNLLQKMQGLSSETKTTIVVFAAIAAALGPALIVFAQIYKSVGLLQIAFVRLGVLLSGGGGIVAAMTAITGPIAIGIAALATGIYLIYKNWDLVKASLVDVVNYFINLYNESIVVRVGVEAIILSFKTLFNIVKLGASIILNAFKAIFTFIINGFKNIGALIEAVFTGNFKAIPGIILDGFKNFGTLGDFVQDSLKDVKSFATINALDTSTAINNALRKNIKPLKQADVIDPFAKNIDFTITNRNKTENEETSKIDPELAKELAKIATELANVDKLFKVGLIDATDLANERITLLTKKLELLVTNGFSPTSDAVKNLKSEISGLRSTPTLEILPKASGIQSLETVVSGLQQRITGGVTTASTAVSSILKNTSTTVRDYYVGIGAGFVDAQGKFKAFAEEVSRTSIDASTQLSQAFAGGIESVGALIGNIISGEGAGSLKVFFNSILTVILDFAIGLGKQLIALGAATESLKKLFTNPIGAVIAGVGLIAVATIVKGIIAKGVPSLAIGTDLVKSDGLAVIHKGEAIVPADVAKGGYSGGGGIANVVGRIQGTDIILASDYSMNFKNRIR